MMIAVLAFLGFGAAFIGAFQKAAAADMKVKELLDDLASAKAGLENQLQAAEADRTRETAQADETLERERTRILAEEAAVAAELEAEIRQAEARHEISDEEAKRRIDALKANKEAALEDVEREKAQLATSRELTVQNLRDRIAAGDVEADRKAGQILENRDQFIAKTKDSAILTLNAQGEQMEYALGKAVTAEAMEVGQAAARIAASAVRRSGTPLLALRQVERAAREEAEATAREARYEIRGTALGTRQKVVGAREEAEAKTEDVMAALALSTQELEDQIERAELDYAQTYANLEASKADIIREAEQDIAAAEAADRAEDIDYQQEIEDLKREAEDAKRRLQDELASAIEANKQRKEDITAEADLLTKEYRRNLADIARKQTELQKNRLSIVLGAAFGATSDVLTSAGSLATAAQALG